VIAAATPTRRGLPMANDAVWPRLRGTQGSRTRPRLHAVAHYVGCASTEVPGIYQDSSGRDASITASPTFNHTPNDQSIDRLDFVNGGRVGSRGSKHLILGPGCLNLPSRTAFFLIPPAR
jgi:hypothetical protein